MELISGNKEIKVPVEVAVCPDCKQQLTIYGDGWEEQDDGWMLDSFTISCATEPDIEDDGWDEWGEAHEQSFDMPYVYWLPVTETIKAWVNKNYRFDLS